MIVGGKMAVREKELGQLRKSGKNDLRTIGQIEKLEWNLDSGCHDKRNKKRGEK